MAPPWTEFRQWNHLETKIEKRGIGIVERFSCLKDFVFPKIRLAIIDDFLFK